MGRRDRSPEHPDTFLEYPRMVKFRVGLSNVYASAMLFDRTFPHVLNLSIVSRPWYGVVRSLVAWLPSPLQRFLKTWFPGAFLPERVVLKKLLIPDECRTELFDNEIRMYKKLKHLQGDAIPRFFGEATSENKRAILLSVVDGPTAFQQQEPISADEFQRQLEKTHAKFEAVGIVYDDRNLDNVILTDDGLVLIDLEWAREYDDRLEQRCHLSWAL